MAVVEELIRVENENGLSFGELYTECQEEGL